jgi:hypothetical protein
VELIRQKEALQKERSPEEFFTRKNFFRGRGVLQTERSSLTEGRSSDGEDFFSQKGVL